MLIGAAVCPHPPILVPAVTGGRPAGPVEPGGAKELDRLRAACDQAVAGLLGVRPDVLVIAGGATRSGEYPLTSAGCLSQFGVWSDTPEEATRAALGGPEAASVLPLSLTVGRWLVSRAASVPVPADVRLHSVSGTAPAGECLAAGARIAALAPRVALLVMGDGPARRAGGVPGAPDPEADGYDVAVADAFAAADARALAALDPGQSVRLLASGRASWQVLAGAAAGAGSAEGAGGAKDAGGAEGTGGAAAGAADGRFWGQVLYMGTPFEVSYLVAVWHRES